MVSQILEGSRGRSHLAVQPKSSLRSPQEPFGARSLRHARPLKSAHPRGRDPAWLEQLSWWKQISTGMAIISGFSLVSLYSWTVHTQSQWSQRYQIWQQMQRNERQFLLTQESIANSLREVASRSEMVPLVPERMIEVPIAVPSPSPDQPPPNRLQDAAKAAIFYPTGY